MTVDVPAIESQEKRGGRAVGHIDAGIGQIGILRSCVDLVDKQDAIFRVGGVFLHQEETGRRRPIAGPVGKAVEIIVDVVLIEILDHRPLRVCTRCRQRYDDNQARDEPHHTATHHGCTLPEETGKTSRTSLSHLCCRVHINMITALQQADLPSLSYARPRSLFALARWRESRLWQPGFSRARMETFPGFLLVVCLLSAMSCPVVRATEIDMRPHWDEAMPLPNPHKGWYHHFPDNHIDKYRIANDSDLLEFPGMDHLYLRLAWSYLEPVEGEFHWDVIDQIIERWTVRGLGIAMRISCRETGTDRLEQQFATPRWVMQAGAQGDYWYKGKQTGPEGPWEPIFDDPVFLEKLENFLRAFGERYNGRPDLRYVDIGSIGDWGEGHTFSGSRRQYGFAQRKKHVDLYYKYFPDTQLITTDDFVYGIADQEDRQRMHRYMLDHNISYRDDSILVNGYVGGYGKRFTVRSPEYFADAFQRMPTVLELQHYGAVKRDGNWVVRAGSSLDRLGGNLTGPDMFRGATELLHATYIGYHGYADEWLRDNPKLTGELLNRCGYWYFVHRVELPDHLIPGRSQPIRIKWENRGVAPAYHAFQLIVRLVGPKTVDTTVDAGNQAWMPGEEDPTFDAVYPLDLPDALPSGAYTLKIKLHSGQAARDVLLALDQRRRDADGFYEIGPVTVGR